MIEALLNMHMWEWVTAAVDLAAIVTTVIAGRRRQLPGSWITCAAFNLAFGLTVGILAVGHVQAVTIKTVLGTLPPNVHWWAIPFGVILVFPGFLLAARTRGLLRGSETSRVRAMRLTAVILLILALPLEPILLSLMGLGGVNVGLLVAVRKEMESTAALGTKDVRFRS